MSKSTAAIAVFVKTPGLSPLKTRLAAGVGEHAALQFYRNSLLALTELLGGQSQLSPYWAVAESKEQLPADHPWQQFPIIHQGTGGLGLRMATILSQLLARHDQVFFIGADTPQLSLDLLSDAQRQLADHDVVFGPAADGGFYLMGTKVAISAATFQAVSYSQDDTRQQLAAQLGLKHRISADLPQLTDADTAGDLAVIAKQLAALPEPLSRQQILLTWLQQRPTLANT